MARARNREPMEARGAPPRHAVRITTRSARATFELGVRLGRALRPGDVVALSGELGTGKTQLARGACRGAGVPERHVASPSFAIVATYLGRIPVHHADLYRVADEDELFATGFFDLLGGEGAALVEWADRIPGALPAERLEIRMSHDRRRANVRHLEIAGTGKRHAALASRLVERAGSSAGSGSGSGWGRGRGRGRGRALGRGCRSAGGDPIRRREPRPTGSTHRGCVIGALDPLKPRGAA